MYLLFVGEGEEVQNFINSAEELISLEMALQDGHNDLLRVFRTDDLSASLGFLLSCLCKLGPGHKGGFDEILKLYAVLEIRDTLR